MMQTVKDSTSAVGDVAVSAFKSPELDLGLGGRESVGELQCMCWVGDKVWAVDSNNSVLIIDPDRGALVARKKGIEIFTSTTKTRQMAFDVGIDLNKKGDAILTCCPAMGGSEVWLGCRDGRVHILSASTMNRILQMKKHVGAVVCSSYDSSSLAIFTGGEDFKVVMWDAEHRSYVRTLHGHSLHVKAVCARAGMLASGGSDGSIMVWWTATDEPMLISSVAGCIDSPDADDDREVRRAASQRRTATPGDSLLSPTALQQLEASLRYSDATHTDPHYQQEQVGGSPFFREIVSDKGNALAGGGALKRSPSLHRGTSNRSMKESSSPQSVVGGSPLHGSKKHGSSSEKHASYFSLCAPPGSGAVVEMAFAPLCDRDLLVVRFAADIIAWYVLTPARLNLMYTYKVPDPEGSYIPPGSSDSEVTLKINTREGVVVGMVVLPRETILITKGGTVYIHSNHVAGAVRVQEGATDDEEKMDETIMNNNDGKTDSYKVRKKLRGYLVACPPSQHLVTQLYGLRLASLTAPVSSSHGGKFTGKSWTVVCGVDPEARQFVPVEQRSKSQQNQSLLQRHDDDFDTGNVVARVCRTSHLSMFGRASISENEKVEVLSRKLDVEEKKRRALAVELKRLAQEVKDIKLKLILGTSAGATSSSGKGAPPSGTERLRMILNDLVTADKLLQDFRGLERGVESSSSVELSGLFNAALAASRLEPIEAPSDDVYREKVRTALVGDEEFTVLRDSWKSCLEKEASALQNNDEGREYDGGESGPRTDKDKLEVAMAYIRKLEQSLGIH